MIELWYYIALICAGALGVLLAVKDNQDDDCESCSEDQRKSFNLARLIQEQAYQKDKEGIRIARAKYQLEKRRRRLELSND